MAEVNKTHKELEVGIKANTKAAEKKIEKLGDNPVTVELDIDIKNAITSINSALSKMQKSFDGKVQFAGIQKGLDDVIKKINSVTQVFRNKSEKDFSAIRVDIVGYEELLGFTKRINENIESINETKFDTKSFDKLENVLKNIETLINSIVNGMNFDKIRPSTMVQNDLDEKRASLEKFAEKEREILEIEKKLSASGSKVRQSGALILADDFYEEEKHIQNIISLLKRYIALGGDLSKFSFRYEDIEVGKRTPKSFLDVYNKLLENKLVDPIDTSKISNSIEEIRKLKYEISNLEKEYSDAIIRENRDLNVSLDTKSVEDFSSAIQEAVKSIGQLNINIPEGFTFDGLSTENLDSIINKLEDIRKAINNLGDLLTKGVDISKIEEDISDIKVNVHPQISAIDFSKEIEDQLGTDGDVYISVRPFIDSKEDFITSIEKQISDYDRKVKIDVDPNINIDYSKEQSITSENGKVLKWYRGVKDVKSGFITDKDDGTFWTTNLELAKEYAGELGKVYESELKMKNVLEIDVSGNSSELFEYLGNQSDETSIKITDLSREIKSKESSISNYENELLSLQTKLKFFEKNPGMDAMAIAIKSQIDSTIVSISLLENELEKLQDEYDRISDDISNPYGMVGTHDISAWAKKNGYDGVIFNNIKTSVDGITETLGNSAVVYAYSQLDGLKTVTEKINENINSIDTSDSNINKDGEFKEMLSIISSNFGSDSESHLKIDVDIEEAVANTSIIQEKIENLPKRKDIEIRIVDYSDVPLLSDEEGKIVTAFRGVKDAWSGLVNDKGISFFTDKLELAADYADSLAASGKIYSANLSFKNPLEVDGKGSVWNEIEFNGIKQKTDDIVEIARQLGHDGIIFKNIRDGFGEANGMLSNVMVSLNDAQIKNEKVVASVKKGTGEIANALNLDTVSPTQEFDNEVQKDLVYLENYKNTIEEINKLKLEPQTDELKRKIEELQKLADYFFNSMNITQSEWGNDGANFVRHPQIISNYSYRGYPSDSLDEIYKIGSQIQSEKGRPNVYNIQSEFSGIAEEIQRIESKSEGLRNALTKDLRESTEYVDELRAAFLGMADTQEELKSESSPKWIERYNSDIDKWLTKFPELIQFKDKFLSYDSAKEFVKTDEWMKFVATLPQAKTYLESIGYEIKEIATPTNVEDNLNIEKQTVDGIVDKEKSKLSELIKPIDDITTAIKTKTQAFREEQTEVDSVVDYEKEKLGELLSVVNDIAEKVKVVSDFEIKVNDSSSDEKSSDQKQTDDTDNLHGRLKKIGLNENELKSFLKAIDESTHKFYMGAHDYSDDFNKRFEDVVNVLKEFGYEVDNVKEDTDAFSIEGIIRSFNEDKKEINETAKAYEDLISNLKKYFNLKIKHINNTLSSKDKIILQGLNSEILDAINGLGKYEDATKEATKAREKFNKALANNSEAYGEDIVSNFDSTYKIRKSDSGNKIPLYSEKLSIVKEQIEDLRKKLPLNFTDDNEVDEFKKLNVEIEKALNELSGKEYIAADSKDIDKFRKSIYNTLNKHSAMPNDLKNQLRELDAEVDRLTKSSEGLSKVKLDEFRQQFTNLGLQIEKTGKTGISMMDKIKKKFKDLFAYFATYVSLQDFIQVVRQGFETIKEYDVQLTEMNKVSDESISKLKEFQKESFDLADSIGTTASQIQSSTADFMRLGESLEQAKQSAQDANILYNVSEFESIDAATESLVSMSQAFKELEKGEIIDVVNNLGNNFAISTDGLATALQNSASALKTAKNDFFESAALTTAANTVVQDPDKVGAGLRTIALRLTGTEAAKKELEELGEDVSDFTVTTTSKLNQQIIDLTKTQDGFGVSLLDMNGNYRSTYDILLDIANVWEQIAKEDLATGENRQNALLEMMAGKNRSNILASILQSPEILAKAYEAALKSEGSALRENEAYLESIEGHINQLTNAWHKLWINDNNREVINFFIDLAKGILDVIDKFGVLNTVLFGGGGIFAAIQTFKGNGRHKSYALFLCF